MTMPTTQQLRNEFKSEKHKVNYINTFKSTLVILITAAAISILISALFLPVLKVVGNSMNPTLENGQIILAHKSFEPKSGNIIAVYYNNQILLKRVIGLQGDKIIIKENGDVYVNGKKLDEPYISKKSLGECDITFPYQVPDGKVFVMGDNRTTSLDSRSTKIGCISEELIVGKADAVIWPLNQLKMI